MNSSSDSRPIGVFDTGLGGLSAVRELIRLMPCEDIIYFGDTGRVPYGNRSADIIKKYSTQNMRFMLSHDIKAVAIACGTISSIAIEDLIARFPGIPIFGVVEPSCMLALNSSVLNENLNVGVLGTAATISAGAFSRKLHELNPEINLTGKACPLFVPLVENGYVSAENDVLKIVAADYLKVMKENNTGTVILGCTHYPLIKDALKAVMPSVDFIDAGYAVALKLTEYLHNNGMRTDDSHPGNLTVYVSDEVYNFSKIASDFLGFDIGNNIYRIDIENY